MNRTTLALAAVSLTLTLAAGVLTPSRSRTAEAPIGTCFDTPLVGAAHFRSRDAPVW